MKELYKLTYGSYLYGTNTPTSDTDVKVVYLPDFDRVLLGKKLETFKKRFDAQGRPMPNDVRMVADGVEVEYVAFQTFARDFMRGQTYAVEVAFGLLQRGNVVEHRQMLEELVDQFSTDRVFSMVSFAKKQTLDYVHRAERLNAALKVLDVLKQVVTATSSTVRLDDDLEGVTVLDYVMSLTGLEEGEVENNNRKMRALKLNGRLYTETTEVAHVAQQVQKLVNEYGHRTNEAALTEVDTKSLSHAVRVYEQSLELLKTGKVTFPRPNVEYLLQVKRGEFDATEVRDRLVHYEQEVEVWLEKTQVRKYTQELEEKLETWLLQQLKKLYELA